MIAIVNGPNLNVLERRDPAIYGDTSPAKIETLLKEAFPGEEFLFFQSNSEGEIIDFLQQLYGKGCKGVVINPGAYAHYSYAIADAITDMDCRAVEVHISNIHAREEYRSRSVTAARCAGVITGFGEKGYLLGVQVLLEN